MREEQNKWRNATTELKVKYIKTKTNLTKVFPSCSSIMSVLRISSALASFEVQIMCQRKNSIFTKQQSLWDVSRQLGGDGLGAFL